MKKLILITLLVSLHTMSYSQAEVFVIRHAESTSADVNSPLLTEGIIRSHKLKVALANAQISRVFITSTVRSRQTAEPIWRAIGGLANQLVVYNSTDQLINLANADIVAGRRILVVGHSDTVPQIMAALGVNPMPVPALQIGGNDDLFEVIYRGNIRELIRLKYGL
jgi:phosphohistidine phosphatase SixA